MTDATTLKPCPFCAGEAAIGTGRNYYFVLCPDCLASTNVILAESIMPTEDEAIAAWNTRQPTQSDALREAVIEECAKALEADAIKCDCAALEEGECACGAWDNYKSITSSRAVEIVRRLQEQSK
jgi:hypothetical protein